MLFKVVSSLKIKNFHPKKLMVRYLKKSQRQEIKVKNLLLQYRYLLLGNDDLGGEPILGVGYGVVQQTDAPHHLPGLLHLSAADKHTIFDRSFYVVLWIRITSIPVGPVLIQEA